jgi:hypothetical protein
MNWPARLAWPRATFIDHPQQFVVIHRGKVELMIDLSSTELMVVLSFPVIVPNLSILMSAFKTDHIVRL